MPSTGFELAILVSERPQTHALDRTATGMRQIYIHIQIYIYIYIYIYVNLYICVYIQNSDLLIRSRVILIEFTNIYTGWISEDIRSNIAANPCQQCSCRDRDACSLRKQTATSWKWLCLVQLSNDTFSQLSHSIARCWRHFNCRFYRIEEYANIVTNYLSGADSVFAKP
jgi:hypothetical protein